MLLLVYLGIYLKGLSSVQSARRHHMDIRRPRGLPRLDGYPGISNFWLSTNLVSLLRYGTSFPPSSHYIGTYGMLQSSYLSFLFLFLRNALLSVDIILYQIFHLIG